MSHKSGSWNQFPSAIATAIICMSTRRVYNFSRYILEGLIGNVTNKLKYLMYPRFLQMIINLNTADTTPVPTHAFTRKNFGSMRSKWGDRPFPPLTLAMIVQAAGGTACAEPAAHEANVADADEAAGGAAEAQQVPQSPSVSLVPEPTPERQPTLERPPSPIPASPKTE